MGTRSNPRQRRRATKRGLASFVSFFLLFAFALGQSSLSALADDASTDPVAAEDLVSDGSRADEALPVAEEEAPVADAGDDGASDSTDGGSTSTSGSAGDRRGQVTVARTNRNTALAAPAAPLAADIVGGDVNLDFVAAGPLTYDHSTGLGPRPQFGYDNRNISRTNGVVESLEGGDFACNDLVTFFVQVEVEAGASGTGSVQLDMSFGAETTGQPGIGFDDIVSWGINTPDDGNVGLDGNETVVQNNEALDTSGYDAIKSQFTVSNLSAGETAIVRLTVHLACEVGGDPTGNILNAIDGARVVGGNTISVGQETVPMKQVGGVAPLPAISVTKSCPQSVPFGEEISYEITVSNDGNEALTGLSVTDTLLGNITAEFPNTTLDVGEVNTVTVGYTPQAGDPDPITNTVTAEADGGISDTHVSATDDCTTDITHEPGIDVTKSCPESVPFGEDIEYTITVENTGNEALEGVTVTDTLLGDITGEFDVNFANPFPVGGFATAVVTYSPGADEDPVLNTVTATGTGADSGVEASDEASCTTDITHEPGIDVTKSCPQSVPAGSDIEYTVTVTNTGNEALVDVTVDDTLLGDITAEFDFDFANPFPVGATATAVVTYTPQAGDPDPITNTVHAVGFGEDSGAYAMDEASCTTDITHEPGIDVTKSCPQSVPFGEDIEYTITVTNTGNEALEGVTVDDTLLGDITGDFDVDFANPFAVGATATAVVSYTPQAGDPDPITNTVTATGTGADSGVEASDEASCTTDITHEPGIDVTKSCPQSVPFGEDIEYTITVTNTGNEALEGVTVDDTLLGDITGDFDVDFANPFAVGATATAVVSYTPQAGDPDPITNTVTATGTGADSGVEASDEASCTTDITHEPGIDVTKSCPQGAGIGDVITYEITITNTGNEALVDIAVNDSILGDVSDEFPSTLEVGESFTAFIDYTVTEQSPDPIHNVVTASGLGADSEVEATDEASCDTDVEHPAIQIVKDGPALVHRGDTITYLFEVTNIGDVDLFDVELTDPICDEGTITLVDDGDGDSMLAIGEVWHYTCTHLVTDDDPDPIPNTGTVTGDTDEGEGGDEVTDTDDHVVDIIHPGIEIVKTVDEETVPIGTTVTYTYVITNTGDTTLYDISVDDDILGHIGDIEVLEPGQSVTLTKDFVVGDEPVTNVGTAEGEDILGRSVSSLDDATVTPIAGTPPEPPTPFTGSDAGRLGLISMVLFGIGVTVVATTRRRRPEREAA